MKFIFLTMLSTLTFAVQAQVVQSYNPSRICVGETKIEWDNTFRPPSSTSYYREYRFSNVDSRYTGNVTADFEVAQNASRACGVEYETIINSLYKKTGLTINELSYRTRLGKNSYTECNKFKWAKPVCAMDLVAQGGYTFEEEKFPFTGKKAQSDCKLKAEEAFNSNRLVIDAYCKDESPTMGKKKFILNLLRID